MCVTVININYICGLIVAGIYLIVIHSGKEAPAGSLPQAVGVCTHIHTHMYKAFSF